MADSKKSALGSLTGIGTAPGDLIEITDISDTTMAGTGTNKKQTVAEHAIAITANSGISTYLFATFK